MSGPFPHIQPEPSGKDAVFAQLPDEDIANQLAEFLRLHRHGCNVHQSIEHRLKRHVSDPLRDDNDWIMIGVRLSAIVIGSKSAEECYAWVRNRILQHADIEGAATTLERMLRMVKVLDAHYENKGVAQDLEERLTPLITTRYKGQALGPAQYSLRIMGSNELARPHANER